MHKTHMSKDVQIIVYNFETTMFFNNITNRIYEYNAGTQTTFKNNYKIIKS